MTQAKAKPKKDVALRRVNDGFLKGYAQAKSEAQTTFDAYQRRIDGFIDDHKNATDDVRRLISERDTALDQVIQLSAENKKFAQDTFDRGKNLNAYKTGIISLNTFLQREGLPVPPPPPEPFTPLPSPEPPHPWYERRGPAISFVMAAAILGFILGHLLH